MGDHKCFKYFKKNISEIEIEIWRILKIFQKRKKYFEIEIKNLIKFEIEIWSQNFQYLSHFFDFGVKF